MKKLILIILVFTILLFSSCSSLVNPNYNKEDHLLSIPAPIKTWDGAIALGNGITGALVWGGKNQLILSLDRGDLWDNRKVPEFSGKDYSADMIKKSLQTGDYGLIKKILDAPYGNYPYPTKLPGARLEISLEDTRLQHFFLDKRDGSAKIITNNNPIKVITCQSQPAYIVKLDSDTEIKNIKLYKPGETRSGKSDMAYASFSQLNYPEAKTFSKDSDIWFIQKTLDEISYCVAYRIFTQNKSKLLVATITTAPLGEDPSIKAREVLETIENFGIAKYQEESLIWWNNFNQTSSVCVPSQGIQEHYDLVKYFYGAASRTGAPPMPLQGVWTADSNGLPPWKGDFHFDLNVQMNYWACYQAGLFDSAKSLTDFMWNFRNKHKKFAKDFYNIQDGLVVPGVMTLDGTEMGGWPQYSFSITNTAWLAYHFYLEWVYSNDNEFLTQKAYPYCKDVGNGLLEFLEEDSNGNLVLPYSTSPEIFDDSPKSWLIPNSNYDLACMKGLFKSLSQMAREIGNNEASKWEDAFQRLGDFHIDKNKALMFDSSTPYFESHRHFSHVMAIYPFELLGDQAGDDQIITSSLDLIAKKGSSLWTGYSFAWASCLEAIAIRPEQALNYLEIFTQAFISENGFHVNGDQSGKRYSNFRYRPFTLEGNFAAMQAVHLMLLNSDKENIILFPAISKTWKDVAFKNLRVKGGHKISAKLKDGEIIQLSIIANKDGKIKLDSSLLEGKVFNIQPIKNDNYFQWTVKEGDIIIMEL